MEERESTLLLPSLLTLTGVLEKVVTGVLTGEGWESVLGKDGSRRRPTPRRLDEAMTGFSSTEGVLLPSLSNESLFASFIPIEMGMATIVFPAGLGKLLHFIVEDTIEVVWVIPVPPDDDPKLFRLLLITGGTLTAMLVRGASAELTRATQDSEVVEGALVETTISSLFG